MIETKDLLKNEKLLKIIFIAGILIIGLIFISEFAGKFTSSPSVTVSAESTENLFEIETQLESRLCSIISKIEGVGQITSMITVDEKSGEVLGVTVVFKGADNPIISAKVIDAVSKALKISSARICVTE